MTESANTREGGGGGPKWARGAGLGAALLAAAALGGGAVFLALRPPEREAPTEEEIAQMLGASAERAAASTLPGGDLGVETWQLRTRLPPAELGAWMPAALERVGGVAVTMTEPVEGAKEAAYLLQMPLDARLRLLLALDALGAVTAPDYEDSAAPLPPGNAPELPASLGAALDDGAAAAEQLSVELTLQLTE